MSPPDLAWAPNAGVAAYPQWQDAVFVCAFARVSLATSEYCEYSVEMEVDVYNRVLHRAEQEGCVGASMTKPRRFLNPFRNPGQRPFPMNLAPNLSNGFCTILDLNRTIDKNANDGPNATLSGATHTTVTCGEPAGTLDVDVRLDEPSNLAIDSCPTSCVRCQRLGGRGVCLRCKVDSKRREQRSSKGTGQAEI